MIAVISALLRASYSGPLLFELNQNCGIRASDLKARGSPQPIS